MRRVRERAQRLVCSVYLFRQNQARYVSTKRMLRAKRLVIGNHSFGVPSVDTYQGNEDRVIIGSYCSIAKNVTMI